MKELIQRLSGDTGANGLLDPVVGSPVFWLVVAGVLWLIGRSVWSMIRRK